MAFVLAIAVRDMRMDFDDALWSATRGGATALRRGDVGHLGPGARADVVILDARARRISRIDRVRHSCVR